MIWKYQNTIVFAITVIVLSQVLFVSYTYFNSQQVDFVQKKYHSVLITVHYFSRGKWQLWEICQNFHPLTRKNVRKMVGVTLHKTEMFPDHKPTISLKFPNIFEGRVTGKLSQDFSGTESHILGALIRPNDFLLDPLIQGHSGTAPDTSWNTIRTNQATKENESQSNFHPGRSVSRKQTTRNSGADDRSRYGRDVTSLISSFISLSS